MSVYHIFVNDVIVDSLNPMMVFIEPKVSLTYSHYIAYHMIFWSVMKKPQSAAAPVDIVIVLPDRAMSGGS